MPQHKSAEKRVRTNEKRRQRNRGVKAEIRNATKSFQSSLPPAGAHTPNFDEAKAATTLRSAQSTLAKAAKKGVIKKNTASRRAGRMARSLHKAGVAKQAAKQAAK